jgi:uncharacterized repeat protein (TIGR03803 family)
MAAAIAAPAQDEQSSSDAVKFKTLFRFNGTNGAGPGDRGQPLVRGTDGSLYGAAYYGGLYGDLAAETGGTIYRVSPGGVVTVMYNFCTLPNCADGTNPVTLVLGADGNLYGVTNLGGAYSQGTVFKVTPGGTLTTLYSFCALSGCPDGNQVSGISLGMDGYLYGTTATGGSGTYGQGTAFKITPGGELTTLYSFCSQPNCVDGALPNSVIQGADGNLYGTTEGGNAGYNGTVFKLTPKGELTWSYNFCSQPNCVDGAGTWGPVVQADNGDFYGSTVGGGAYGLQGPGGTVYKITPAGALTTLYSFCAQEGNNCPDGSSLYGGVVQGTDRNFYGITYGGGVNTCNVFGTIQGCGTIFRITPGGELTTLHDFDGRDGDYFLSQLTQDTYGNFYGIADFGGNNACTSGCGTLYGLAVGLHPFIETVPAGGKAGDTIQILGDDLTNATSVTFNGAAAGFTVVSKTLISATVPAGATTGFVKVAGPSATLKSNARFAVLQ